MPNEKSPPDNPNFFLGNAFSEDTDPRMVKPPASAWEGSNEGMTGFVGGPQKPKGAVPGADDDFLLLDSPKPSILVSAGPEKGKQVYIGPGGLFFGRGVALGDMLILDKAASRRHAKVYQKGGRWYLCDLGSTNGTYFGGPLRGAERVLSDGDIFRIGDWEFTFNQAVPARK